MTEHLPEVPRHTAQGIAMRWQGSDIWGNGVEYVTYVDHVAALRACEARVADDLTRQSDDYTTGYAVGQADMRKYLLADDTHSYTYGYAAALDAARDAVA